MPAPLTLLPAVGGATGGPDVSLFTGSRHLCPLKTAPGLVSA